MTGYLVTQFEFLGPRLGQIGQGGQIQVGLGSHVDKGSEVVPCAWNDKDVWSFKGTIQVRILI